MRYFPALILLTLLALMFSACGLLEPVIVNPYDPGNPDYSPPETVILEGPSGTVTEKLVTFIWHQNNRDYWGDKLDTGRYGEILYRYRLNSGMWSPWFPDTSVTLNYLDDITYSFEVMSKYPTEKIEESPYASRSFTMSSYSSALVMSPRMTILDSSVAEFSVAVAVEKVIGVMGIKVVLDYDPSILRMVDAGLLDEAGHLLRQSGGEVVGFVEEDGVLGRVSFDIAVVKGDASGVSGSGDIAEITFERLDNRDAELRLDEACSIHDVQNQETLEDRGNGMVYVW